MKFNLDSFVDLLNRETDRRNLLTCEKKDCQSIVSCPLPSGCSKTVLCSLDAFFRSCVAVGKRKKIVGNSKTRHEFERPEFCKKCKQLKASKRGELAIDLAEYGIEINESMIEKHTDRF